jgi:predicted glycoside hydrolase/deacetylase ChbG (UPF0249 family)
MKYLIVNGDDFGASPGINGGIVEAHCRGILTSTSLLVDSVWTPEAAEMARNLPRLSIGLHIDLPHSARNRAATTADELSGELDRQWSRFTKWMGRPPTHLDSHHNVHRLPEFRFCFVEFAQAHGVPLREHSPVRYFSSFYGRWNGEAHLEQISVSSLIRMLAQEIYDGVAELSCHPGYHDAGFKTDYSVERETELRTLCDPTLPPILATHEIELINYNDLASVPVTTSC